MARTLRKHYGWTACALAALLFAGFHAIAIAGGKKDIAVEDLNDLINNPTVYTERDVAFYCRFAVVGKLFKEINTNYSSFTHINIAVWPHQARLWEDEARRQLLPTLYINKDEVKIVDQLRQAEKYDLMLIRGRVTAGYGNMPWINVTSLERLPVGEERFTAPAIAQLRRACELLRNDDPIEAKAHFEQAMAIGVPPMHRSFVQARIGECWKKADMPIQSLPALRAVSNDLPNDPYPRLALAEAELAAGNPQAAIEAAKKALEITPRFGPAQSLLGEAYGRQGQHAQGLEMISLAEGDPSLHPREKALLNVRRARIFIQARRYADAVESYARAIADGSPLSGEPWLRREIASLYEERFEATQRPELLDDAIAQYKNANAFAPRGDAVALCRAAEAEYNRSLRLNPGHPDYGAVRELLLQADQVQPAFPPARALQARMLYLQGDTARAEAIFKDLLAECANDPAGLQSLAETYEALGRGGEACDLYNRILQMEPWNRRAQDRRQRSEACRSPIVAAQQVAAAAVPGTLSPSAPINGMVVPAGFEPVTSFTVAEGTFTPGIVLPSGSGAVVVPSGQQVYTASAPVAVGLPRVEVATTDASGLVGGPTQVAIQPIQPTAPRASAALPSGSRPATTVSTWYLDD